MKVMAMNISSLMAISEASTGYVGGSYVDELPHLGLLEAASTLPCIILEAGIGFVDNQQSHNEGLVNVMIESATTGVGADFGPIVEASFEDLKKKIKAFFDRIIKWLRSIIAKIGQQIDKMRLSGHQLYEKYKSQIEKKDFTGMTFTGYAFKESREILQLTGKLEGADGVRKLVSGIAPESPESVAKNTDALKKATDKITAMSSSDRSFKMAKELCAGADIGKAADSWESTLKEKLYGEKVELKYGSGKNSFNTATIAALLSNSNDLEDIKKEYVALEKSARDYHDELQKAADEVQAGINKLDDNRYSAAEAEAYNDGKKKKDRVAAGDYKNAGDKAKVAVDSAVISYYNAYMGVISDSYAVINKVKSIHLSYRQEMFSQAKAVFGKMLSYKAEKKKNEDADLGEDTDFSDFEI